MRRVFCMEYALCDSDLFSIDFFKCYDENPLRQFIQRDTVCCT